MKKRRREKLAAIERREAALKRKEDDWKATSGKYDLRKMTTEEVEMLSYSVNTTQLEALFLLKIRSSVPKMNCRTRDYLLSRYLICNEEVMKEDSHIEESSYVVTFLGDRALEEERQFLLKNEPFFAFVEDFDGIRLETYLRTGGMNGVGEFWASGEMKDMLYMIDVFEAKGVGFEVDEEKSLPEKNLWCFFNMEKFEKEMGQLREAMDKVFQPLA